MRIFLLIVFAAGTGLPVAAQSPPFKESYFKTKAFMKKIVSVLVVFLISISYAESQVKKSESQQAVEQTVVKMFDALSNRDSLGLKEYCAADILLFENGMVWNLDTLIMRGVTLNKAADFKRINTIDFIITTVNQNTAWTTYNNQADISSNENHRLAKWVETVVLVKNKNGWKIKLLHSTPVKRE
jgi:hypothetical protein